MTHNKAAQKSQRGRGLRVLGAVLLIVSLLFCVWMTGGATAYGWMLHAENYGAAFAAYGKGYFCAAGAMTTAVILYFCKRDLPAAILGSISYLPMLLLMLKTVGIAAQNGWGGQTEQSFARTAAEVWREGLMWNFVPLILLLILALTRYFSYDAAVRRAEKRSRMENAPAPSILADDADSAAQDSTNAVPIRSNSAEKP